MGAGRRAMNELQTRNELPKEDQAYARCSSKFGDFFDTASKYPRFIRYSRLYQWSLRGAGIESVSNVKSVGSSEVQSGEDNKCR